MSSEAPAAVPPSTAFSGRSGPAAGLRRRPNRRTPADLASESERALYGVLLKDVRFLRQRGFGIHREGRKLRVGNRLVSGRGLRALAARERRLLQDARRGQQAGTS
jgi:hypothetical protein